MKIYIRSNRNIDGVKFEYSIMYPEYEKPQIYTGTIGDILGWKDYIYNVYDGMGFKVKVPTQEIVNALQYQNFGLPAYVDETLNILE